MAVITENRGAAERCTDEIVALLQGDEVRPANRAQALKA